MALEAKHLCLRLLKESNKSKFDSYSVRNSVFIISHITFRDCRVHNFFTTFLEIAVHMTVSQILASNVHMYDNVSDIPWSLSHFLFNLLLPLFVSPCILS